MTDLYEQKSQAASCAVKLVENGMVIGLGSGSTATIFINLLAQRLRSGELHGILGIPTSEVIATQAQKLGIPLTTLEEHPHLDLDVDGADEISPTLDLIKGLGGALLREKIVAQAAQRFVVVADSSKIVSNLGEHCPLPIEVLQFGWSSHIPFFRELGGQARRRRSACEEIFLTDSGNFIFDVYFPGGIDNPTELQSVVKSRAGIIETGLFLGMADDAMVAGPHSVQHIRR